MLNYDGIPNRNMEGAIKRYVENGLAPGGFMTALLSNDLKGAVSRADEMNKRCLVQWVEWLYWQFPSVAWGSPENVAHWIEQGGMKGMKE